MTTYSSKHRVPYVPGPMTTDGFHFSDSYVISQDITAIQAEARALGYLNATVDGITLPIPGSPEVATSDTVRLEGWLSWTGVMRAIEKAPQSHAAGRTDRAPMPVWPVVLILCGLSLVALAVVAAWLAPLLVVVG